MPPDDTDPDRSTRPVSIPMTLGGVVSAEIIEVIDPTADAEAPAAEPTYEEFAAQKQNLVDALTIRNEATRVYSERRMANAELLGALGSLLRPSVLENGFSTQGVTGIVEDALEQTLIAVLGEVKMMAMDECYEDPDDDESDAEGGN